MELQTLLAADAPAMSQVDTIASFRRVTPAILASARLAMANDVPDTSKAEISLILKKAAPVLGIDGTTYQVLDILLGLSRADDWKGAGRPIVAISNAKLAEYTSRSERTVARCLKRIVEAGIAAYRDSPTGRRFVYRAENGDIKHGYGLDFTPARVRLSEIKDAVEKYQANLHRELEARRAISSLSRAIVDACTAYPEHADAWRGALENVLSACPSPTLKALTLRKLHDDILVQVDEGFNIHLLTGEGDIDVIPYINTNPNHHPESKQTPRSNERENKNNSSYVAEEAYEKKHFQNSNASQSSKSNQITQHNLQSTVLASVPIGLLQASCREAQEIVGVDFESWGQLLSASEMMRRMIGLSESAWIDGVERVGRYASAAILATVLEKSLRDPEQIAKPGGYFRAMVDRATEGDLHLNKSLYGLAEVRATS